MRRLLPLVAPMIALIACDTSPPESSATTTTVVAPNATVAFVSDGDTIGVRFGAQEETVRLLGIDTPETKDPDEPVQCFGPEATAFTKAVLPRGSPVRVERDVEARDQYGRLLGYVYRTDGTFVNAELARQGYADVLSIAPNTAHADELQAAVATARQAGLGLWGTCAAFGVPA